MLLLGAYNAAKLLTLPSYSWQYSCESDMIINKDVCCTVSKWNILVTKHYLFCFLLCGFISICKTRLLACCLNIFKLPIVYYNVILYRSLKVYNMILWCFWPYVFDLHDLMTFSPMMHKNKPHTNNYSIWSRALKKV